MPLDLFISLKIIGIGHEYTYSLLKDLIVVTTVICDIC